MDKGERLQSLGALEDLRKSKVLTYLTADRGFATTQMAEDALRVIYDHVRAFGEIDQLDLLIYSRGGDAMLPWPLVNVLRSCCKKFAVLVPFKAHSAATLVCLGADEIVMTQIAQLTPVEPTVKMPFSPGDQNNPGQRIGINVEDVASYFEFTRERAEVDGEGGKSAALQSLAAHVHPVALGNLHRMHKLARLQSEKLLGLHMDPTAEAAQVEGLVERLVAKLWAHEYKIGRVEAEELGLKVAKPSSEVDEAVWALFEAYEAAMELRSPIEPQNMFNPGEATASMSGVKLVYVESTAQTDVYKADLEATRTPTATPPGQTPRFGPQVQVTITRQGWENE